MKANDAKMIATLKDLGFIKITDEEVIGYYKTYKGFRLFVAQSKDDPNKNWIASITVGKQEISIPLAVNEFWVYGFNEENNGY